MRKYNIRRSVFALPAFTLLLFSIVTIAAATNVSGPQSGNWNRDNNPYMVTGNISIDSSTSLYIEAGVHVIFTGPYAIYVRNNAVLRVRGDSLASGTATSIDTVTFTSSSSVSDSLGRGIRYYQANGASEIRYAKFRKLHAKGTWPENCGGGLYVDGCSPHFNYVEFYLCSADFYGGAMHFWFSNSVVDQALVDSCSAQQGGGGIDIWYSNVNLRFVTAVRNNLPEVNYWLGAGVLIGSSSLVDLSHCILTRNQNAGSHPTLDSGIATIGDASSYTSHYSFWKNITSGNGNVQSTIAASDFDATPPWHPSLTSPFVDDGDPSIPVGNEPQPNGNRINIGYYAGTSLATQSFPVASVTPTPDTLVLYGTVKIGRQILRNKTIKNISRAPNQLYPLVMQNLTPSDTALLRDSVWYTPQDSSLLIQTDSTQHISIPTVSPLYDVNSNSFDSTLALKLYWRPDSTGNFRRTLTWRWNNRDTINHTYTLVVRGTGINPSISVNTNNLNFGQHTLLDTIWLPVVISNLGTTALSITDLTSPGVFWAGFDSVFRVRTATIQPRYILNDTVRYHSANLNMAFIGDTTGYFHEILTIVNNDSQITIPMYGESRGAYMRTNRIYNLTADSTGFVQINQSKNLNLRVYNGGNEQLRIDSIVFNQSRMRSNFTTPITIGAADTVVQRADSGFIPIVYSPGSRLGLDTIRGIIYSNSRNHRKVDSVQVIVRGILFGTYLSSTISGTLTAAHSPYVVTGTVLIDSISSLRLEAGDSILFEPNSSFKIRGKLTVAGTTAASVQFVALDSTNCKKNYLDFEETSFDNQISYAHFYGPAADQTIDTLHLPMIRIYRSTIGIDHSMFTKGRSVAGGAIYSNQSSVNLSRNLFVANSAKQGAVVYAFDSHIEMTRNKFAQNNATDRGAVIYVTNRNGTILSQNDIYVNNTSHFGAVAVFADNASGDFNNCVFNNNYADSMANIIYSSFSVVRFNSTLITGTAGVSDFAGPAGYTAPLMTASYVERTNSGFNASALWGGDTNYVPTSGSPAIDAGDPNPVRNDYWFPPALGTAHNDAGITGGPLAGSGEFNRVGLVLFANPVSGDLPDVIIYTLATSVVVDTLYFIPDFGTTQTLTFTPVSSGSTVYRSRVTQTGAALLTVVAHESGATFRVSRRIGVISSGKLSLGPWTLDVSDGAGIVGGQLTTYETGNNFGPGIDISTNSNREVSLTFEGELPGGVELALFKLNDGVWQSVVKVERGNGKATGTVHGAGSYKIAPITAESQSPDLPVTYALSQPYPNPFNPSTSLTLTVPVTGNYTVSVVDLLGRTTVNLYSGSFSVGAHRIHWDGRGSDGHLAATGIYWVKVSGPAGEVVRKMLLLK